MIEKRFTWLKKDVYAPQIVITDSLTEKDLTPIDCYELLNELANENEQLKSNWEYEKRQHKHWKTECLECIKEVSQLKREIVQLKGDVE